MKYSLSNICKAANRFKCKGYSRSAAFILAWRLAKHTAISKVSGVCFADRQEILERLSNSASESISVELRREIGNRYDSNAVAVILIINGKATKLGYLPKAVASLIACIIDLGQAVTATLDCICGGCYDGMNYGAKLRLAI